MNVEACVYYRLYIRRARICVYIYIYIYLFIFIFNKK